MKVKDTLSLIKIIDDATPITSSFIDSRTILLAKLNSIMRMMNDEECYMAWIEIIPDEATFEEFADVAADDKFFNEVLEHFLSLFKTYKYGE